MISLEMASYRDSKPGSQSYPVYGNATEYPNTGDFIAVVGNEPSAELTCQITEGMRNSEPTLPVEQLIVPGSGLDFTEVRERSLSFLGARYPRCYDYRYCIFRSQTFIICF